MLNYFISIIVYIQLSYKKLTMKQLLFVLTALFLTFHVSGQSSFYDFKVKTLEGDEFDFSALKGKKVLIVNTASKCGYTPQYADLEKLFQQYGGEDFTIIGFPANNFNEQEPGTNEEIRQFCTQNYGVSFPMMEKISVKGTDMHPLYRWLTSKKENGVMDSEVKWNFQKYLIDENGKLLAEFDSAVNPQSNKIVSLITGK